MRTQKWRNARQVIDEDGKQRIWKGQNVVIDLKGPGPVMRTVTPGYWDFHVPGEKRLFGW